MLRRGIGGLSVFCGWCWRFIFLVSLPVGFVAEGVVQLADCYCLGSYILFTHMMAQRSKVLRGKKRL